MHCPDFTSNSILSYVAVWPSGGSVSTAQHLAGSLGFPGLPRQMLWVGKKKDPRQWHLPRAGEYRVRVRQHSYPWLSSLLDKVWARAGAAKTRLCRFRPDSCNAIFWCFPSEKFIIRTACLGIKEPREEMWFAFRRSSCWPSPIFFKGDSIILQSQPLLFSRCLTALA